MVVCLLMLPATLFPMKVTAQQKPAGEQAGLNLIPDAYQVFIPYISNRVARTNYYFGVESQKSFTDGTVASEAIDLDASWVRMGLRVSWRLWQPTRGGPIDWTKAATFEKELRLLNSRYIKPVVIVYDSPYWAVERLARQ